MQIGVTEKNFRKRKNKKNEKNLLTITYVYDNLLKDCRRQ